MNTLLDNFQEFVEKSKNRNPEVAGRYKETAKEFIFYLRKRPGSKHWLKLLRDKDITTIAAEFIHSKHKNRKNKNRESDEEALLLLQEFAIEHGGRLELLTTWIRSRKNRPSYYLAGLLLAALVIVIGILDWANLPPHRLYERLVAIRTPRFCDDFDDSKLDSRWTWIDPLGDSSYSLTDNPGHLRLYTPDGGHDLYQNLDAPRLVQPITGDFTVTTKLTINPQHNYQGAGLLIWQDANNYINLHRTLVKGVNMGVKTGGIFHPTIEIPFSDPTMYLSIQRSGNSFTGSYSVDGFRWVTVSTATFPALNTLQVGLVLINQWQDNPIDVDFDYFEVDGCYP